MAIGRINATLTGVQPGGLAKIVPTSVAVGSGSGSADTSGLVSFSGASSVSINSCFTSTYENYRILFRIDSTSGNVDIRMRVRTGGSDVSTSTYSFRGIKVENSVIYEAGTTTTSLKLAESYSTYTNFGYISLDLLAPNIASNTRYNSQTMGGSTTGAYSSFVYSGVHDVATAYDSISFFPGSGTITGNIRIYGYN